MSKEKVPALHIKTAAGHFALAFCPPHISLLIPFSRKGYEVFSYRPTFCAAP